MVVNKGYRIRACYFPILPELFYSYLPFTLVLLACGRIAAAERPTNPVAADELKQLNDQTLIQSAVFLDTEWDQFKHGAGKATWTLGGLWGWPVSDRQDWAIRLKLPFAYERRDESSGHADIGGLGDIEVGTGTAFRLSKTWRTAGGVELHTDTASDSALAEKVWRLKSSWGIAHDVTNWLTFIFEAAYNHSIEEGNNVEPQRYLELSLPGTIILPHNWSIFAKYKAEIDFENGDRWTHTLNGGVAKRLANLPFVLSADLEKPLNSGAEKFQANFTMTYYFKK